MTNWDVFDLDSLGILEIQKDESGVFTQAGLWFHTDAEAVVHVMNLACRWANPVARAAIRQLVNSWDVSDESYDSLRQVDKGTPRTTRRLGLFGEFMRVGT